MAGGEPSNLSTEYQKPGDAARPKDTLDRDQPEYDMDPQSGGGTIPQHSPKGGTGGDAPNHGSR